MIQAMWQILLSLAPWMLLGMAIAGILHVALPRDLVRRELRGRMGVIKAVALGVPLPLCSCGVIPAGLGLKKDGASSGSAVGFLISTPQTGVDSILVSASFLGWPFAIFKVLSAAVTGIVGGLVADAVDRPTETAAPAATDAATPRLGLGDAVDHGLMILRTIWGWIVFGVVVSAAIEVFVPQEWLTGLTAYGAIVPVLVALAISLPLYVCSTASVPIAAALVAGGMPPGAALVFLMAGPATNVATIGAVFRALGGRALTVYLGTITAGSVVAALAFDFVLRMGPTTAPHAHGAEKWWSVASAVVLLGLMVWFAAAGLRRRADRWLSRGVSDPPAVELGVAGMKCNGCVSKLEKALLAEDGVASVEVTLEPGKAVVRGSIDAGRVRQVVERLGFEVAEA
jgi:uncharacterized membrane protein YraQ (UPF0718 family)/copper chaperone CopZ